MCMLVCMSSDDITTPAADAPIGSITSERAIANAMMVRTSRIEIEFYLCDASTALGLTYSNGGGSI